MARLRMGLAEPALVCRGDHVYSPWPVDSTVGGVVVTPPFELAGRPSSVEVAVSTDLDDARVRSNHALIEQRTGRSQLAVP